MTQIRLLIASVIVAFAAGCSPEGSISDEQQNEAPAKGAPAYFYRKGEYETDSSFENRQATIEVAAEFFANISEDNCLARENMERNCYRAFPDGSLEIYKDNVLLAKDKWRNVNNSLCIKNQCLQVHFYMIQPYTEYQRLNFEMVRADLVSRLPTIKNHDSRFKLDFISPIVPVPSIDGLEKQGIEVVYNAYNDYDLEGDIILETFSIIHKDGELLATAKIDDDIHVPPGTTGERKRINVRMTIVNEEKLKESLDTDLNSRHAQLFPDTHVSSSLFRDFNYEYVAYVDHPVRPSFRQRSTF